MTHSHGQADDPTVETAIRKVASLLWTWESSGQSDLAAAVGIAKMLAVELLNYGPDEADKFERRIARLFPDIEQ
ncbi:MAG: hypothetical protein H0U98_12630 [Alphaproteobacteria bacterium]|nr:hypothetical protein [Alphaproteobacteria bacterium]